MLFNSIEFLFFLPIVFVVYWFVLANDVKKQNFFLLVASYFFYGLWDYRFLGLIVLSSVVDYYIGISIYNSKSERKRKSLLWVSISLNLGLLLFFKYFNFFIDSFVDTFQFFGFSFTSSRLSIILPVGISFYTFQTLSYSIDIYKRKLIPSKDIIPFLTFVSFFPQLVAGPIERAKNLLPQFSRSRVFDLDKGKDGLRQILWGLFKKVVIADNCASIVNVIFDDYTNLSGFTLLSGSVLFAFQIYGDFSGYSDIAIGTARLFGFDLMKNFSYPYFSRDIGEFWRRWHISLSGWFKDYVYIPLGGSRGSRINQIRNVFAIFLISGFWHGANFTYLFWGGLNAIYFLPLLLMKKNRINLDSNLNTKISDILKIIRTFTLVTFSWIFFRSNTISDAFSYIYHIYRNINMKIDFINKPVFMVSLVSIFILIITEWFQRDKEHGLFIQDRFSVITRWTIYFFLVFSIFYLGGTQQEFIYFQF